MSDQLADKLDAVQLDQSRPISEDSYHYVEGSTADMNHPDTSMLSVSTAIEWQKAVLKDPKNRLALTTIASQGPAVLTQRDVQIKDTQKFNVKISLEGAPITNQRSSGRCWLFAATNVFRVAIMKKYNLKEFELSQSYLFFWDKLEKANWFLEQILDTLDEPIDGRLVQELLKDPVGDGGQWDMAANLVEKYGLLPQPLYPDTWNAQNSRAMNQLITTKLREDCYQLRDLAKGSLDSARKTLRGVKDKMMRDIHRILIVTLGPPPNPDDEIVWEYHDKDEKLQTRTFTPLEFAAELEGEEAIYANSGVNVHKLFSLVNDPRNIYNSLLGVDRLGNVVGLRPVRYVNVSMDTMKEACIAMLKADVPIFFGSDVGKHSSSKSGIMDLDLIDYELGFGVTLGMDKAQRLLTGESAMTHAMVLTAVHLDNDGKPLRWRVQNSWGDASGTKGWFVMTDRWMDEFVYQAVVDPRFVSEELQDVLKQDAKMLPRWDPMGALA